MPVDTLGWAAAAASLTPFPGRLRLVAHQPPPRKGTILLSMLARALCALPIAPRPRVLTIS